MRIVLCAYDAPLFAAFTAVCREALPHSEAAGHLLEIMRGDITALRVAAVVSPANSYGYMRGGVDLAYTRRFGPGLEARLQGMIAALPEKCLPVGRALPIATGDAAIPYLISAPTMKTPMRLTGPEPIFAAARAAAGCAVDAEYEAVAFPGMGTGTGGLAPEIAARAMLRGICEGLGCPLSE